MSADCLSFGKNKNTQKYEVVDDDCFYEFKSRKKATDKLKELLGNKVDKNPKLKKIKFENLEWFYKNYSTGYTRFMYLRDKVFKEIIEKHKGAWETLAKL